MIGKPVPMSKFVDHKCTHCKQPKVPVYCPGNDECVDKAMACEKWAPFCCQCGADYAKDQI